MRLWLIFLGLLAVPAWGQGADDSPFLPVNAPAPGSSRAADGSAFELRGIMSTAGGTRYCIYDPVKNASAGVGLKETVGSFTVKSADGAHDTVTLDAGGQRMTLALHEAKVVSL